MHDDDVQFNDNSNKRSDNIIEFKSRRTNEDEESSDRKEWQFTLEVYKFVDKDGYEFNVQQEEVNPLDDLSVADILARAAFQIAPDEFSEAQEVAFEPDFEVGNDGWVDDDEDLLGYVIAGNKELTDD